MRLIILTVPSLIIGLLASTTGAAACGSGKLIFEDKFATLDSWTFDGSDAEMVAPGPNGLVAKVPPGKTASALHQPDRYDNFEVCASFEAKSVKGEGDFVALRFWTTDGKCGILGGHFHGQGLVCGQPLFARREADLRHSPGRRSLDHEARCKRGQCQPEGQQGYLLG